MTTFTHLTTGDRIGVRIRGRRHVTVHEAIVTKVTAARVTAEFNGSTTVYERSTGHAHGRHSSGMLVALDDPEYLQAKAEQETAARDADTQRRIEQNERETRFNIAAIAGDDKPLSEALHFLAGEAMSLEQTIRRRLERVTPENLYRELKWLEDSAAQSATLNWLTGVLSGLVRDGSTPRDQLVAFRDHARSALLTPSSCLSQLEDRAQLLAAREVYEKLDGLLRWKLS